MIPGEKKEKKGKANQYTAKVLAEINRINDNNLDPDQERALDINEGRSIEKVVDGEVVKCKVFPRSKTKIGCLMAGRTNGYWLLKRGRRMRSHEALRAQGMRPNKWQ